MRSPFAAAFRGCGYPPSIFESLRPGDILYMDSSHVFAPGFDVQRLVERILPLLPSGLLDYFQDVFLPEGYTVVWAAHFYNEQSAVTHLPRTGGW